MASVDIERAVLNCVLMDKADARSVQSDDLRHIPHQLIHEAILAGASDSVLVLNALPHLRGDLNAILETPGGAGNLPAYLGALRRQNQMADIRLAAREAVDHPERADEVANRMKQISNERSKGPRHVSEGLWAMFTPGLTIKCPLGIHALEALISPEEGHLCVFGARPRIGKTSMLTTIALAASRKNWQVLFLSLEMTELEIRQRLIASNSGIPLANVKAADDERLVAAGTEFLKLPIWIEADFSARGAMKVSRLGAMIERFAYLNQDKSTVVLLDYLQLVKGDTHYTNRVEIIGETCRELKWIAKRAKLPLIVGAQLSRAADMRASAHPQLSDLRESGEIEAVADQVVLMHRLPDKTLLCVAKNRHGVEGFVDARFDGPTTLFTDKEYF